jgi:para-nitrobenzyl esterase
MNKKSLTFVCLALVSLTNIFGSAMRDRRNSVATIPIASTTAGQIKGFVEEDGTLAFLGIQYAVAERYGKPQPVPAWQGAKFTHVYGPVAKIPEDTAISNGIFEFAWPHRDGVQSEDCLYLNVWTQSLSSGAGKPVMFFIHGGGFNNGSSIEAVAYEGGNLSKFGDVVVVTVNHRLNVLGYLDLSSFGDAYKDTANLGMLDLVAALQWVKNNIAQFGGDPNNVTIFGQSGGSAKVATLYHMPAAKGLFARGIGQSSGGFNPLTKEQADRVGQLTAQKLGLTSATIDQIKTIDYHTLLAAALSATSDASRELGANINWSSVADNDVVLSDYPDWANALPYMAGTVFSEMNTNLILVDQGINKNNWTSADVDRYLGERFGSNASTVKAEFTRLFPEKKPHDVYFYAGSIPAMGLSFSPREDSKNALAIKAKTATAPVYNYLFAFEAPANGGITAFHCAELIYVFHNANLRELAKATGGTADVYKVQDTVARAWVNFATTGNPSQPGLEWAPFDPATGTGTMIFDVNSRFAPLDDQRLLQLMVDR